jgi:predicted tellurium resistance membrane protein TerC
MIELMSHPENWIALATLTALEIVLGIDNIVFIAILSDRVPAAKRALAYRLGLGGAMVTRIALLLTISWVMGLVKPLFTVLGHDISGRALILLAGGIFLIGKSAHEIYEKVEGEDEEQLGGAAQRSKLIGVVVQIMLLDIVFSLDSVITAVGMVEHVPIMITAIVIAIAVMLLFAQKVGEFVNNNPSMKILALSFLLLIGVLLTAEGMGQHMDKGYIYFAMGFALLVELLNLRFRKKHGKHHLKGGGPKGTGNTPEKPKIEVDPDIAAPAASN